MLTLVPNSWGQSILVTCFMLVSSVMMLTVAGLLDHWPSAAVVAIYCVHCYRWGLLLVKPEARLSLSKLNNSPISGAGVHVTSTSVKYQNQHWMLLYG